MAYKKKDVKTLDELLDEIEVGDSDQHHVDATNGNAPLNWHFVADDSGVMAYFAKESDACRFRLAEVNRRLNP